MSHISRRAVQAVVAVSLVALGWSFGARAAQTVPDFELIVRAPVGETTIECASGCNLAWVQRGVNPAATPTPTFRFMCRGASVTSCSSGKVGGWRTP